MRRLLVVLLAIVVPRLAFGGELPADDPTVYTCNKHVGDVTVTFKPEIELKELVTWAMGLFYAGQRRQIQKKSLIWQHWCFVIRRMIRSMQE